MRHKSGTPCTIIRIGAAHYDMTIIVPPEDIGHYDIGAMLKGKSREDRWRLMGQAAAAICEVHGIAHRPEPKPKPARAKTPRQRRPSHRPTVTMEATL